MKKLLLLALIITVLLCVSVSALPEWSFENGIPSNFSFTQLDKSTSDGLLVLSSTGNDPYITIRFTDDQKVDCAEYKFVAISFKSDVTCDQAAVFFGTDKNPGPTGDQFLKYYINPDNQWHGYVVDCSSHPKWDGSLNLIRIDPYNNYKHLTNTMYIEKIGVFKTEDEANAFLQSDRVEDFNGLYWVFDEPTSLDNWGFQGASGEFYENVLKIKVYNSDPIMSNDDIPSGYDCTQYKYVAFNMNTVTTFSYGLVFFANTNDNKLADNKYVRFNLVRDGKWNDYIVDMTTNKNWNGNLTILRLDPQNGSSQGVEKMYVGRIGLFKTREEAQRFLDAQEYPAENENPVSQWDLTDETDREYWLTNHIGIDSQFGVANFIATGTDMYLKNTMKSIYDAKMQAFPAERKYMAIRYNATLASQNKEALLSVAFNTDGSNSYPTANTIDKTIIADGTFHELIINMSSCEGWKDYIKSIRIDPVKWSAVDDNVIITSIGFFETYKEAQEYLASDTSEADFSNIYESRYDKFKAVIPPNTLTYGYELSKYMMSSTTPSGEGETAVAVYTDTEGNEKILAFGDVNATTGYVRYMANKPGNYSVKMATPEKFSDMDGHWAEEYVDYISVRGITNGTDEGIYTPEMPVTRGMFVTILGRALALDTSGYNAEQFNAYADVNPAEYYAPYIEWSKEKGILPALSDGRFAPEMPITRGNMAVAVRNLIRVMDFDIKVNNIYAGFEDVENCTDDVKSAIDEISSMGIINGVARGRFLPEGLLTRAETATVLTRLIKASVGAQYMQRFEKEKFTIGAFGFSTALHNTDGFNVLRDMDVDYIISGGSANNFLRLAEEYNLSVFAGGRTHSWWGDNGQYAGTYDETHAPEAIIAQLAKAPVSDAIVADYIVDEPSALDYEAINEEFLVYSETVKGKSFPFINLYPNYGKLYDPNNPEALSQLGTVTYQQYVDEYVEHMDLDYISFDNYPYGSEGSFKKYLQNLDEVASAARDNDLYMWVIIQTGQWEGRTPITSEQLQWQMYLCMAYGATSIMHACYSPQWWGTELSCVDPTGEKNPTYYMAQEADREIRTVGEIFMDYDYLGTYGVGYGKNTVTNIKDQLMAQNSRNRNRDGFSGISGVTVTADGGCAVGCFENKENTSEKALMLVNCADPFSATEMVTVNATVNVGAQKTVTVYADGVKTVTESDESGNITVELPQGEGVYLVF